MINSDRGVSSEILKHIEKLPFWDDMTDDEQQLMLDAAVIRTYDKDSYIHSPTSDCLGMVFILEGEIRLSLISEEGREITLFRLHENDICMLTASCVISQITFDTHVQAQTDTKLLIIAPHAFKRITESNIYVRCFMYEITVERFSAVMWSMQQILFLGFDRRLASFLVGEYDRTGSDILKMTHEQIALNTSSAREVVARMLKRFSEDGLVELKRGSLRLVDIDSLRLMV